MRRYTVRFAEVRWSQPVPLVWVCEGSVVVKALYGITPQHALNRAVKWMREHGDSR